MMIDMIIANWIGITWQFVRHRSGNVNISLNC